MPIKSGPHRPGDAIVCGGLLGNLHEMQPVPLPIPLEPGVVLLSPVALVVSAFVRHASRRASVAHYDV